LHCRKVRRCHSKAGKEREGVQVREETEGKGRQGGDVRIVVRVTVKGRGCGDADE
jgi:hypothetical protein